jgi:hypothetical protein
LDIWKIEWNNTIFVSFLKYLERTEYIEGLRLNLYKANTTTGSVDIFAPKSAEYTLQFYLSVDHPQELHRTQEWNWKHLNRL